MTISGKKPAHPNKTILIVDDDPDLGALVSEILSLAAPCRYAPNAAAALKLLADGLVPDLFVLDVMMPGMDGFELAQVIKATKATAITPMVFLTTRGGFEDVVHGINVGARHYVTKPFKAVDLLAKVNKILGP